MKIEIVAQRINNTDLKPQGVAFQAKMKPANQVIESAIRASEGTETAVIVRSRLKDLLETLKVHAGNLMDVPLFNVQFSKARQGITRKLRSWDINKQQEAVQAVFEQMWDTSKRNLATNVAEKYLWNTVVPYAKKPKNRRLADYILTSTISPSAQVRIKLLRELGNNEKHLRELEEFDNKDLSNQIYSGTMTHNDAQKINFLAKKAIEIISNRIKVAE